MITEKLVTGEKATIISVAEKYRLAVNVGDLKMWIETLTDDVVSLPPDHPRIDGKEATAKWVKETFFDPFKVNLQLEFDELEVLGSSAILIGRFSMTLTSNNDGSKLDVQGKFTDILREDSDGAWKFASIMWNSDVPPMTGQ
jgi:ketosteroid isomerase-like protein